MELHPERVLDDGSLGSAGSGRHGVVPTAFYRAEGADDAGSNEGSPFVPTLEIQFASQSLSSPARRLSEHTSLPWALQVTEPGWQGQFAKTVVQGSTRFLFDGSRPHGAKKAKDRRGSADSLASQRGGRKKKVAKKKKTVVLVEPPSSAGGGAKVPMRATAAFQANLAGGLERYQRVVAARQAATYAADDDSNSASRDAPCYSRLRERVI